MSQQFDFTSFDFINRANAEYIDQLYQKYQQDPRSVETHWRAFFAGFEAGGGRQIVSEAGPAAPSGYEDLVHAYRELGHFVAKLDPLGHNRPDHPLLQLSEFGLTLNDLDRQVGSGTFLGHTDGTLRDLIEKLRSTYCGTIGVEFMDISDKAQREWLIQRMEPALNHPPVTREEAKALLFQLVAAQGFEEYLQLKFQGKKRFSVEGSEAVVPLINTLIDSGVHLGVEEMVMGMAHRGRLNVLAHVLNKPYETILAEFEEKGAKDMEGDGDVKYHLGYSNDRTVGDKKIHLALSFNPSHLELVNPVVEGIVRAKQYYLRDDHRTRVVPLLIHGDAAFTGQGIVMETLGLSEMPYWRTGGTIHLIINNQIGFTTMPKQGRFTPYPTDIAKAIQAPVFHVNGDDPEACVHAAKLAVAFRQQFHCDVMIDVWCYRRHGHNEVDEPAFTQPLMYKEIDAHPRPRELYANKLIAEGTISQAEFEQMKAEVRQRLDQALSRAHEDKPKQAITSFGGVWRGMSKAGADWNARTEIPIETIRKIGERATVAPPDFHVNPKIEKLVLEPRRRMGQGKVPIDWGGAEMFALGSLLLEGTPIRFVGQDAQRGTFSHRHACLHDVATGKKFYPLQEMDPAHQAPIAIVNTMLSELAVLGFEYGFSSADPRNLVIWEAQFGDFVNGAQPIIDQFIVAAESKWQKMCGLVLLLPHGYEGQGPEHSYAYLDRFLALCAENNIQVAQPSLPSQYFHLLRRQMKRNFRKPLVLMMPKSLLRHALDLIRDNRVDEFMAGKVLASASRIEEFTQRGFQAVLDDPTEPDPKRVRRVLFCSGKVFFTLAQAREKAKPSDVALVRVEQFYPFPEKEIRSIFAKYRGATEIGWVQDEPENRGAWRFMDVRLRKILPENRVLTYYGREEAASPATGAHKMHEVEEQELLAHALELPSKQVTPPPAPEV
ncbi:MAG TPA: 2-oxoglutarate dehydrogenase E1 component, partial [Tepidisphaeraceae bacterium]